MKKTVKKLISKYTPLSIKKSVLNIWLDGDTEFQLFGKMAIKGAHELYERRFVWSDLKQPLESIRERFGLTKEVFLLTDREDRPGDKAIHAISAADLMGLDEGTDHAIILAFESDERLIECLKIVDRKKNLYYYCPFRYLPTARYFHKNDIAKAVLTSEHKLKRGKFDLDDFENIIQALEITRGIQGDYVEIGVYKGDSAHAALHYMKVARSDRKSYFFDLFSGFTNESSEQSGDAAWLNSHTDTSQQTVQKFLGEFNNFTLAKLDIVNQDLPAEIRKIAVCNIDVDIYEAVKAALAKVAPLISIGGIIILEDQGHTPFLAGAYLATVEFIQGGPERFVPIHMTSGQMLLLKV
jgi:Macrocin-O-methyltransferase (TylF)